MERIEGILTRFFTQQAKDFIGLIGPKLIHRLKATADDEDATIKEFLDRWIEIVGPMQFELQQVFADAAMDTATQLEVLSKIDMLVLNEEAVDYAKVRAAELVGKKNVGGQLVANPDAKWAITETTRDELKQLITDAFNEGMTPAELAAAIRDSGMFSASRAKMIAETEMSRAQIKGSLETAKRVGGIRKRSQTSSLHVGIDECDEAEEMGTIAVDATFGDLGDGPPYHPRCHCVLILMPGEN